MTTTVTSEGQHRARVLLTVAFVALGVVVAAGFIRALLWGVIMAIAIEPVFARAVRRWPRGRRSVLPAVFTVALLLLVVVPLVLGLLQASAEAHTLTAWLGSARANGVPLPDWVASLPFGREAVSSWWQATLATPEAAANQLDRVHGMAVAHSRALGTQLLRRLVALAFALVTLFFVLRDHDTLGAQLHRATARLFGPVGDRIAMQLLASVRGTINGLVLVGLGEGAVMGVAYALLGVPHPVLLGALTGVAAMIPLGAVLLIGIAALLLLGQGATTAAIGLVVIGLVVIGVADHVVRPVLIGGATKLPFLWVLVGILGGVEAFGLIGLFVGPAAMAVLVMLWRDFIGVELAGGTKA